MNVFGMPLFVDYYSTHDPETGEVSFAPHTASKKGKLEAGVASKTQFLTVG